MATPTCGCQLERQVLHVMMCVIGPNPTQLNPSLCIPFLYFIPTTSSWRSSPCVCLVGVLAAAAVVCMRELCQAAASSAGSASVVPAATATVTAITTQAVTAAAAGVSTGLLCGASMPPILNIPHCCQSVSCPCSCWFVRAAPAALSPPFMPSPCRCWFCHCHC